MPSDAIAVMLIAMVLIWGGLTGSILYAVRVSRAARVRDPKASAPDG